MPVRHGCFRVKKDGPLVLNFGILSVFLGVLHPRSISSRTTQERTQSLHFHFSEAIRRLAFCLDVFQQGVRQREEIYALPLQEWGNYPDQIMLAIAADSIAHYINICFDDVWRVVPLVFDPNAPDDPDSWGAFTKLLTIGKFAPVKKMFDELKNPGTWWHSMLMYGTGIRQRLVHYTDMFSVQGSRGPNDERIRVETFVWKQDSSGHAIEFVAALRNALKGFCDWLERLEVILVNELSAQCATQGVTWTTPAICPRVLLPVGMQEGIREIPDDFLYLPVCDGSLPIKGNYKLTIQR